MKRPSVAVGVIIRKEDRVLMLRRAKAPGAGMWDFPGGRLKPGEAFEQCAVRETEEEAGIIIADVEFAAVTNDRLYDEDDHFVTIWMRARWAAGEARVCSADEISEVGWFQPGAWPQPLFQPAADLVQGRCYPSAPLLG
jgi:8-oxo-dGTP diphosphatase